MDDAKRELIRSWLTKAKSDPGTAQKLAAGPDAYPDTAIYHCQQAPEKSLKAFLVLHDQSVPRVHDLRVLLQEVMQIDTSFSALEDSADLLTPFATAYSYPGPALEPTANEVQVALDHASEVYRFVLAQMPSNCLP